MEAILVNALKLRPLRFGQWQRHAPEAARKVLIEQLRELEEDQIVFRKAFRQAWEGVEYELTVYERTLVPVLTLMAKWGKKHKKLIDTKKPLR